MNNSQTIYEPPTQPEGQQATPHLSPDVAQLEIHELAKLSPIEYDQVRESKAKYLGIRTSTLDSEVKTLRPSHSKTDDGMDFDDVEPWPEPVNGIEMLDSIVQVIKAHIICPTETAHAASLWITLTWAIDVIQVAPLAVITAPEKRCGKSQLLFLLGRLVKRPLAASNISPAALFRAIDAWKPTLLVDEADAFMRDNEELRGLLNCGHTRESAYIIRVVGDDHTPKRFNAWGAKALAGIGHLPDTIMDRSIVLELRRKLPSESVQKLRHADPDVFKTLTAKLARFTNDNKLAIRQMRPSLPGELHDRAQDNWEPLLAIASVAGGHWPDLAQQAALKLSGTDATTGSVGNELLADIRESFERKRAQKVSISNLLAWLLEDEELSWVTYNRGRPMTARQMTKQLKTYGIKSKSIRVGYEVAKGYELLQFDEAFDRYLSPTTENPVTSLQASSHAGLGVTEEESCNSYKTEIVTRKPAPVLDCNHVTENKGVTTLGNQVEVEI